MRPRVRARVGARAHPHTHTHSRTRTQVVILGSGAPDYEAAVQEAEEAHPYHVRGITKFDEPLAHR